MFSKRIREAFEKFARYTTLHGINRIVSSKHVIGKLLWTCIVLTCIAVCFMQIYKLGVQYGSKQVNTKVSIRYQKVYFPAVSFCNLNPVSYSKMKQKADDGDYLAKHLVRIHRKIRTKIDKQFEKASTSKGNRGKRDVTGATTNSHAPLNVTIQTSNYKVLYGGTVTLKCEVTGSSVPFVVQWLKQEGQRTININSKNTSKYNHNYDNGSEISTASLTIFNTDHKDTGVYICTTRNINGNDTIQNVLLSLEVTGSLKMLINVNQSDYVPYVASDAGIRLVIHEHGSQPFLENSGISVATGFRTDISLIQFENFLSNIGGTLGLWIGMSLISIGELVELGFFLLRSMARQKKVIETQTTVNGEKAAEPSKGSKNLFVYLGMNPIDEGNGDK
ncbi:Hypothetical predicted protein [Mytilus galloprovincialis]|uniref:Ig-like domain-containing protein n=1 Tax=Mytilus galloprovincialis TaxID=29158 RepID=A0A8B6BPN1_MYTGA|nr:Hypothetical predicted protein [Mytilus galloprovincialis]